MEKINALMIIDDDPIHCHSIQRLVERSQLVNRIIIANNGVEALQKICEYDPYKNLCPEVILVDIEMPLMDGLEFLEAFKAMEFRNKESVKTIVNSATINPEYTVKLQSLNIKFYFDKAVVQTHLTQILGGLETAV